MNNELFDEGSISPYQRRELEAHNLPDVNMNRLSQYEAAGLVKIHDPHASWRRKPMTTKQREFLDSCNMLLPALDRGKAAAIIDWIMAHEKEQRGFITRLQYDPSTARAYKAMLLSNLAKGEVPNW